MSAALLSGFRLGLHTGRREPVGTSIAWVTGTPQKITALCGSPDDAGCAVIGPDGTCTIYTPLPPVQEYSPYVNDQKSWLWVLVAHEVAHCFGWNHPAV